MRSATERLVRALGAALLLLLLRPAPAIASAITAVNTARSVYCGLSRAAHAPLSESLKLDEVARLLARGESLERAEVSAGYEATLSVSIRIAGARGNGAVEQLLGRRFCGQIADPRLRQVGIYGRGDSGLWIVAAQPFTAPRLRNDDALSAVVLALTNAARAQARTCGSQRFRPAPPLSLTSSLTHAAREHSLDMVAHDFFSHTGSDGSTPGERATRAGYRWSMLGENIASGVTTPQRAVAGWLASPEHCANIMTPGFRTMGVAFAVAPADAKVIVWTEDFGAPRWRAK